ncbi:ribose 5-phosphate isomerase B [Desmospora profundinema]|uniref:Ribose 5-phosphate isomerase B n=1 Tax=Desmospora profundinema TaxID=1571184 RepID=A0ABU1IL83_9BACL|nr:ribose 5-phosphate isomerase B [Desmospora profundinema]MDR6225503.1 ribose 5-phosphate isomerase B [Desmospora profundinema]
MRVIIGSDHGGYRLKETLKTMMEQRGIEVEDVGCECEESVDYPDYALPVARRVAAGDFDRGVLVCGTGLGMSIAANKVPGVRCAVVSDTFSARMSREHNNANVLALGERVVGPGLAEMILSTWLETDFAGGRHSRRVEKIGALEGRESL